ncbi:MAG TPA: class I SAM-dependent methyltransferase [Gaiella sp.]|nr:class I SAM-dependent methyltransferase [Gaiella sp.]
MAFEELTTRHAQVWSSAPFERIAEIITEMHVELVERLAPEPGEHWLDLGCGTGDVAFHAARAGAIVTGSDLSPALIETAQRQASELGLDLTLEVADCQALHYPDASFDVVSSSVGVIFAPDHARVAAELARVCKPGGRLGITAWRRDSGVGDIFTGMAKFMPPPPEGAGSPFQWADEAYVEKMLGNAFELTFEELDTRHDHHDPAEMWELFRSSYGPSHVLWSSLDEGGRRELDETMTAVFEQHRDGDTISMERRYIVVTGVKKA